MRNRFTILALILLFTGAVWHMAPASAEGAPTLALVNSAATGPDTDVTIAVTVSGVADMAGFDFDLEFDPTVAAITGFALTTALGDSMGSCDALTGRCALALGPLDRSTVGAPIGRLALGGYSYGAGGGLDGGGTVATITLHTLPTAHGTTALQLIRPIIVATDGTATIPTAADSSLTITVPTAVGLRSVDLSQAAPTLLVVLSALGLLAVTWRQWRRLHRLSALLVIGTVALWAVAHAPSALAAGSPTAAAPHGGAPINPDINGDLKVDVVDAQAVAALHGATPGSGNWNAAYDLNADGVIDALDSGLVAARWRTGMHTLTGTSPRAGEATVALTRETIVHFSGALDLTTVQSDTLTTVFNGGLLAGRSVVSADADTLTRFHNPLLPPSSRISVLVDGDGLVDADGYWVDTDGDGQPGGTVSFTYDTISLSTVDGTAICGHVYASELSATLTDEPIVGATISVDGAESTLFALTDSDGYFCLDPAPLGRFFVHVDGRTATNSVPPGAYYPFVGKPYQSTAGHAVDVGIIYLPLVVPDTLQPVSPLNDTVIHFPPSVISGHPEYADVAITVPADSLYADNGARGGMVGIAPVPPDRLPGQLPDWLGFPLVITVQTDGATNFDTPAPICFPNLPLPATGQPLPANGKSALHSFNHDSGTWTVVGPMTVSADGLLVCTDPGVGIEAPGWHGSLPGVKLGVPPEPLPPPDCPEDMATNPNKYRAACAVGTGGRVGSLLGASALQSVVCNVSAGPRTPTLIFDYLCDLLEDGIDGKIENAVNEGKRCQERFNQCLEDILGIPVYRAVAATPVSGLLYDSRQLSSALTGAWTPQQEAWLQEYEQIYAQLSDDLTLHIDLGRQFRAVIGNAQSDDDLTPEQIAQLTPITAQIDALLGGQSLSDFYMPRVERMRQLDQLLRTDPDLFGAQPQGRYLIYNHVTQSVQRGETLPGGALDDLLLAPNTRYSLYRVFPIPTGVADTVERAPGLFSEYDFIKLVFGSFETEDPGACEELPDGGWYPGDDDFPEALRAFSPDVDGDGDRLSALEELIIGTSDSDPDSDDDGTDDGTEFLQGTNPTDGLTISSGVIAGGPTAAPAQDVCVANNVAMVAEGSAGVELFDVFNNGNPVLVSRIDTLGSADRVVCTPGRLAIADAAGGALVYNTTIPTDPVLLEDTITVGNATAVTSDNLTAYFGTTAGQVLQVDLLSGQLINHVFVGGAIADIGLGEMVYVLTANRLYTLDRATLAATDTATLSGVNRRLFVGDDVLTIVHKAGYSTYDLSDPTDPLRIAYGTSGATGWRQMALNGSGLGLAGIGATDAPSTNRTLNLFDVSDPAQTDVLIDVIDTPGRVNATSIYNALAYVADDDAGLQVVNYLPNDELGVPPLITLSADDGDLNVEPGQIVRLRAAVSDDVQVRNVFFSVDGQTSLMDGTYPFNYALIVPPLAAHRAQPLTVRAVAIDTGGNAVTSADLTLNVVADATAPTVTTLTPNNNSVERVDNVTGISAQFSEVISQTALAGNVTVWEAGPDGLTGTGDDVAVAVSVVFRPMERLLTVTPNAPLAVGKYLVTIGAGITDRSGNPLDQAYSTVFSVRTPVFWKNPVTGNWQTGSNWSTNVVPTANDYVVIDHTGSAFTVNMGASSGNAGTLEIRNPDAVVSHNSGSFTFQDDIINYGQFQIGGPTGNTTLVNGDFFNQGRFRSYPVGANSARINGRALFNNGTALIEDLFYMNRADTLFVNNGDVDIRAAGQFVFNVTGATFIQSSGFITITSGGRFYNSTGTATLILDSGHMSGSPASSHYWRDTAVTIGPEMTFDNTTLTFWGNTNTLDGDIPVDLRVWLRSNARLTTEGDWVNDGRILLGPSAYGGTPYSQLYINNGTLTNNGAIEDTTNVGSGASERAAMYGNVVNNGLIRANEAMDFKQPGATLTNNGTIDILATAEFFFSGANQTFIQASGTITVAPNGRMHNTASPITVAYEGGRFTGSTRFWWSNVALSIAPAMEFNGATFRTNGVNTLTGDIPAGLTLWISSNGDLTTEGDWTNNGRLLLGPSAYGGTPYSRLYINNGTLTNNGTLEDTGSEGSGSSDRAAIFGNVINEGLIRNNLPMNFKLPGATLVNNGVIDMAGNAELFDLNQVTLTNNGVIQGDGRMRFISAPNVLDGTLEPGRADRAAIMDIRGGMTQLPTSVLNIEIGGLTVDTQYDQLNVGDANFVLDGTLNISLINGFVPALGNTFTIITSNRTRSGTFAAVHGLAIDATKMFEVTYLSNGVRLTVVEGTFKVNDPGDAPDADLFDGLCDSDLVTPDLQCTLRAAIQFANGNPGLDAFGFDLPPGSLTIQPLTPLPSITGPTIFDGYTQPGASPNTLAVGNDAVLLVELDGSLAGFADGLQLTGGGSTIRGLVINRFEAAGIRIHSDGNHIAGNFIGTDAAGVTDLGNLYGVSVSSGSGNQIGGVDPADRNLVSGNGEGSSGYGIYLQNGADENFIQGNYVGADRHGMAPLSNAGEGMYILSDRNTIGGTAADAGNLVSGNGRDGIELSPFGSADENVVQGNLVGVNATGTGAIANGYNYGINVGGNDNLIGGATPQARNIVSGNVGGGIGISGSRNSVQGNYIGVDITGESALGNNYGVYIADLSNIGPAADNSIGGSEAGAGNVIAGNLYNGIRMCCSKLYRTTIQGNLIGVSAVTQSPLGNGWNGISVVTSETSETQDNLSQVIGGRGPGEANVIAYNGVGGVHIGRAANPITISGNSIVGNGTLGIDLEDRSQDFTVLDPGGDGVTPNDPSEQTADEPGRYYAGGGNLLRNFPVIEAVAQLTGTTTITGSLNSVPNATFELEFYANTACSAAGYGGGETYLGMTPVTTDANGNAAFVASFPVTVPAGQRFTATSTDAEGNTSEFSRCAPQLHVPTVFTVTTTADSGPGSLRQAIMDANANDAADTIVFDIAGPGPHTITPLSRLPNISDPLVIDGETQPGAACPTPVIEIDGSQAGGFDSGSQGVAGLTVGGGASTVRGLIINRFSGAGIHIKYNGGNVVECNFIGTDSTGTVDLGNLGLWRPLGGIYIEDTAGNQIGGANAAQRNLISGNGAPPKHTAGIRVDGLFASGNLIVGNYIGVDVTGSAILANTAWGIVLADGASANQIGGVTGAGFAGACAGVCNLISGNADGGVGIYDGSDGNSVQGNFIGTDVDGATALPNGWGVIVSDASNNTIGGTVAGAGNLVSGNTYYGISLGTLTLSYQSETTRDNVVQGNRIGTDRTGALAVGNNWDGVLIYYVSHNLIGGSVPGAGNLIAFNGRSGVLVSYRTGTIEGGVGNHIVANAIFANGDLGIDLGDDGVTLNDAGDGDSGANLLQNYPLLSTAATDGVTLTITGTLDTLADTAVTIDVYVSTTCAPSGYGEGETYIGAFSGTTDGSGQLLFDESLTATVPAGALVTATATDAEGNTSEFSACLAVQAAR